MVEAPVHGVSAFWLMLGALGCYAIAYRFYSGFIARRVLELDGPAG